MFGLFPVLKCCEINETNKCFRATIIFVITLEKTNKLDNQPQIIYFCKQKFTTLTTYETDYL